MGQDCGQVQCRLKLGRGQFLSAIVIIMIIIQIIIMIVIKIIVMISIKIIISFLNPILILIDDNDDDPDANLPPVVQNWGFKDFLRPQPGVVVAMLAGYKQLKTII